MYKIIGADGKEYGPVTAEQLKQWMAEGRANAQTRVLAEGAPEWQTLGEIAELAPAVAPAGQPGHGLAKDQVKGPALALIVIASLGLLYYLFNGVFSLVTGGAALQHEMPSNVPPEFRAFLEGMRGPLAGCVSLAIAALNAFVLFGAIKMIRLQSHGLAMAAAIVALLPCQCCCVVGLPIGIWALVVLSKPEVKSAFQ
jgi:hypothetical protein